MSQDIFYGIFSLETEDQIFERVVLGASRAGSFGSNEIQGTPPGPLPGLAGAKSNVDAAAAGIFAMKRVVV